MSNLRNGAFDSRPAIKLLLAARGPSTIARFVVPVVINAIQRQARRAWAKLRKELAEILAPFGGHRDSPAAVVSELFEIWVKAAILRVKPLPVFASMAQPMSYLILRAPFSLKATATTGMADPQRANLNDTFIAAIAEAFRVSLLSLNQSDHRQPPEFKSDPRFWVNPHWQRIPLNYLGFSRG